jgi:hypothetical protein
VREIGIVVGIGVTLLAFSVISFADPAASMEMGRHVMLSAFSASFPFWVSYFFGMAVVARRRTLPRGWYWRSYEHHASLVGLQRYLILGSFIMATLTLTVSGFGIVAVVIAGIRTLLG